ncbi:MAG: TonB-dependent receptor, partial [Vicinamibacterales bacterium]
MARLWLVVVLGLAALPAHAAAQILPRAAPSNAGSIHGIVTTQNGAVPLAGVAVSVLSVRGEVATAVSEGDGTFLIPDVAPGQYSIVATAQGFESLTIGVVVGAGERVDAAVDLRVSILAETVEVVAPVAVVPSTGTLTSSEGLTSRQLEELGSPGGLESALRLLVSVIEVPGGVSIKGGRPSQATVQLGPGAFVDPTTGLSQVTLPDDAIDTVTVLPNPYAVEYGRFSSGLVLIQTRRATDSWRTRLNRLEPSFRTERGRPLHVVGLSAFSPRFETGGPLIANKLFLQQAAQYRYRTNDVPSRPISELKVSNRFSSFTRIDANATPRHLLVGAVGLFPASVSRATLATFTPPEASVNIWGNVSTGSFTERSLWSDTLFGETTVEVHRYITKVTPRGSAAMELLPETTRGNFFNEQTRGADTYQLIETLSGTSQQGRTLHFYKAGVDVLHTRYEGTSASRPLLIERSDGTLARRLDFSPVPTAQHVTSTDLALFAQDRIQPSERLFVEVGARLDRDGVIGRLNLTPRVGAAVLLNRAGTSVIRSGFGVFFERTPSVAGAFGDYESALETRYGEDGVTRLGAGVRVAHLTQPDLETARSATWDLALDHRFSARWAAHLGIIKREGSHELLLRPQPAASGALTHVLTSDGQSSYREIEASVHFSAGQRADVHASYVRSRARADLNAFTSFYDNVLWPVVGENAYAPARADSPHRMLLRGRATPLRNWQVAGTLDWHTGLPYSVVNASLDFVGPRNARRFPNYVRADLAVERRLKLGKLRPWVGVRSENALSSFLPSDVQANIDSPAFGTFYNSEYR